MTSIEILAGKPRCNAGPTLRRDGLGGILTGSGCNKWSCVLCRKSKRHELYDNAKASWRRNIGERAHLLTMTMRWKRHWATWYEEIEQFGLPEEWPWAGKNPKEYDGKDVWEWVTKQKGREHIARGVMSARDMNKYWSYIWSRIRDAARNWNKQTLPYLRAMDYGKRQGMPHQHIAIPESQMNRGLWNKIKTMYLEELMTDGSADHAIDWQTPDYAEDAEAALGYVLSYVGKVTESYYTNEDMRGVRRYQSSLDIPMPIRKNWSIAHTVEGVQRPLKARRKLFGQKYYWKDREMEAAMEGDWQKQGEMLKKVEAIKVKIDAMDREWPPELKMEFYSTQHTSLDHEDLEVYDLATIWEDDIPAERTKRSRTTWA